MKVANLTEQGWVGGVCQPFKQSLIASKPNKIEYYIGIMTSRWDFEFCFHIAEFKMGLMFYFQRFRAVHADYIRLFVCGIRKLSKFLASRSTLRRSISHSSYIMT